MYHPDVPGWLRNAVGYQIYPQSFQDSNGDGIGDLQGIIERLDYLKWLGCDFLWLNPVFDSPFGDAGYDIRDFYQVAERYGTNNDLRQLFDEAHRLGIRVLLDLVAGHTSIEHPWFQASASAKESPMDDYFIWTDVVWEKPEGMDAIKGYGERDGSFATNFFWFQPALNYGFANPDPNKPWQQPTHAPGPQAVRRELRAIMRHWLDMGCDGFRVDMASSLIKGEEPERGRALATLWRETRTWLQRDYPEAVLMAEWSKPTEALAAGFHVDLQIHVNNEGFAYMSLFREKGDSGEFPDAPKCSFHHGGEGDFSRFSQVYETHLNRTHDLGYICVPSGNHDIAPRLADYRNAAELRVAWILLMTLPGTPIIYYGDEIGMPTVEGLVSKEGGYSRTGVRTPMLWSDDACAGFSKAEETDCYLPLGPKQDRPTVENQLGDEESLLNFVRQLIALRKQHPELGSDGELQFLDTEVKGGYPIAYTRGDPEKTAYLVVLNPTAQSMTWKLPKGLEADGQPPLRAEGCTIKAGNMKMQPTSYGIFPVTARGQ